MIFWRHERHGETAYAAQVRFFRKGKPFKYEGKLFFEELFAWVEKMTAPA